MSIWNWLLAALIVDEIINDEDPQVQEDEFNDYDEDEEYDDEDDAEEECDMTKEEILKIIEEHPENKVW